MEWTRTLERVTPLVGSVTETAEWATDERLDDLGGIFHLAALVRHCREDAEEVQRTNVQGTLNMVRLAASAAGRPAPRRVLSFRTAWWLARLGRPFKLLPDPALVEMASRHWSMRSRYAAADLDYRSRPGQDTMAETVAWLNANHPELAPTRRRS
jgi:hypothetical protein